MPGGRLQTINYSCPPTPRFAGSNTSIYKRRVLTHKKLARCTATDLSILSRPRGQRGEFSNLCNAPVKFFMATVINDECVNELSNSANFCS